MKDYRIEVKVKNNYLWTLMQQKGIRSISQLGDSTGINRIRLYNILNLKVPLYGTRGWTPTALRLAAFFGVGPDALVPAQHVHQPLETNSASFEASLPELPGLTAQPLALEDHITRKETVAALKASLDTLRPRERDIIKRRYLTDPPETQAEISKDYGVTKARISAIEQAALRKLRHPARSKPIREALTGDGSSEDLPLDLVSR